MAISQKKFKNLAHNFENQASWCCTNVPPNLNWTLSSMFMGGINKDNKHNPTSFKQ